MKLRFLFLTAIIASQLVAPLSAKTITLKPLGDINLNLASGENEGGQTQKGVDSSEGVESISELPPLNDATAKGEHAVNEVTRIWALASNISLYRNMHNWKKEQEALSGKKVNLIWNLPGSISFSVSLDIKGSFKEALSQLAAAMKNTNFPVSITFNSRTNTVSLNQIIN